MFFYINLIIKFKMKYTIAETDIINAIIKLACKYRYLWNLSNNNKFELDERLEYTFDLIRRINKYLTKKYKLSDDDLTDYNIFVVWVENENELSRQIDGSN